MTDDEVSAAAARIIETRIADRQTRERALAELADATIVRRGNAVGFLVPALDGWSCPIRAGSTCFTGSALNSQR
jgi:hypothetical protein